MGQLKGQLKSKSGIMFSIPVKISRGGVQPYQFVLSKDFNKSCESTVCSFIFFKIFFFQVFAKRLMYRSDTGLFEIEPPVKRTTHVSFVYKS